MTTAYATYTYYTTAYLGTAIVSADFNALALCASAVLDQLTFGRAALETVVATVDSLKMACCAVAEELQNQEESSGGGIQSESIGANSVSYVKGAAATLTDKEKQSRAASVYLGSTGLMYKGFLSGEYGGTPADED